jgi:hypothetical protein
VDEKLLDAIRDGQPVSAVSANIVFDWMTLASSAAEQSSAAAGAGGTSGSGRR